MASVTINVRPSHLPLSQSTLPAVTLKFATFWCGTPNPSTRKIVGTLDLTITDTKIQACCARFYWLPCCKPDPEVELRKEADGIRHVKTYLLETYGQVIAETAPAMLGVDLDQLIVQRRHLRLDQFQEIVEQADELRKKMPPEACKTAVFGLRYFFLSLGLKSILKTQVDVPIDIKEREITDEEITTEIDLVPTLEDVRPQQESLRTIIKDVMQRRGICDITSEKARQVVISGFHHAKIGIVIPKFLTTLPVHAAFFFLKKEIEEANLQKHWGVTFYQYLATKYSPFAVKVVPHIVKCKDWEFLEFISLEESIDFERAAKLVRATEPDLKLNIRQMRYDYLKDVPLPQKTDVKRNGQIDQIRVKLNESLVVEFSCQKMKEGINRISMVRVVLDREIDGIIQEVQRLILANGEHEITIPNLRHYLAHFIHKQIGLMKSPLLKKIDAKIIKHLVQDEPLLKLTSEQLYHLYSAVKKDGKSLARIQALSSKK